MTTINHPEQPPLFWFCDICGGPHLGLAPNWAGERREHRRCGDALDRWYRADNRDDWISEPTRAVL